MAVCTEHHDSELGRWLLARWAPPDLAGLVEGIWYFEGSLTRLRERHFPTGRAEIIVHLGQVYRHVEGTRSEPFPMACASGLLVGPDVIEAPPGRSAVLGIRLHPLGAFAVLGHALEPLTGITVDLEDLAHGEARRLIERCTEAQTPEGRVRAAAQWTADRVRSGPRRDAAISWAISTIEERAGALSIGDLAHWTGWSGTRFTETFRAQVGVTPKRFARIIRFRRALDLVIERDGPLVEVALEAGYYDQPHFNAEFREMSGFTPSAYRIAHRFPESASLVEHVG